MLHQMSVLAAIVVMALSSSPAQGALPIKVACVGDSITAGYLASNATVAYPGVLQSLLDAKHGAGTCEFVSIFRYFDHAGFHNQRLAQSIIAWQLTFPPCVALGGSEWVCGIELVTLALHGCFHVSVHGLHVSVHGLHVSVHGLHVSVHGLHVSVHGLHVLVHGLHVSVHGLHVSVHGLHVSVHGLHVSVHGLHVSVHGLHVSVHGMLACLLLHHFCPLRRVFSVKASIPKG
jgi:hypothetical protein